MSENKINNVGLPWFLENALAFKKLKELTIIESAYLAGLMDGEGSIMLTRNNRSDMFKSPKVSMPSTSLGLIKACADMTGIGSISQKKKAMDHHKQSYVWAKSGNQQVLSFIRALFPYMKEESKWKRSKKLLSEWDKITKRNGKYTEEEIMTKLKFEQEFYSISN